MAWINGGVRSATDTRDLSSKAKLRAAVADDPADVTFYSTSQLGEVFNGRVSEMPDGVKLQVTGPDPFTNRRWYATIERTTRGWKVS